MHASMITGLAAPFLRMFWAVKIVLASRTVRLLDGGGLVAFGSGTYAGSDAELGTISGLTEVADEIAVEETGWSMSLVGTTQAGVAELIAATYTGRVSVYCGLVDETTGLVIGEPDVRFDGYLEPVGEQLTQGQYLVRVEASSSWARLLRSNEGQRLNNPFHGLAWPGESGLEYTHGLKTFQQPNNVYVGSDQQDSSAYMGATS